MSTEARLAKLEHIVVLLLASAARRDPESIGAGMIDDPASSGDDPASLITRAREIRDRWNREENNLGWDGHSFPGEHREK